MTNQFPDSDPKRPLADEQDWFWSRPQVPGEPTQAADEVAGEPTQVFGHVGDVEQTRVLGQVPEAEQTRVFGAGETAAIGGQAVGSTAGATGAPASPWAAASLGQDAPQQTQQYPGQPYPTQGAGQPTTGPYATQGQQAWGAQAYASAPEQPTTGQPTGVWGAPTGQSPWSAQPAAPAPASKKRGLGLVGLVGLGTVGAIVGLLGPTMANTSSTSSQANAPVVQQQGTSNGGSNSGTSNGSNTGTSNSGASNGSNTGTSNGGTSQGGWGTQPNTGSQSGTGSRSGAAPAEQQPFDPWGQGSQSNQGATNEQSSGSAAAQTTATTAQSKGIVLITTRTTDGEAAGTGMVLTTNGYVLTNYHVVQSSTQVQVTVASTKQTYTATVVGHDATNDVALLKLSNASGLDTVTIDKDGLSNGQAVTAVGNSEGQGYLSQATGKVTSLDASITVSNESAASGKEELSDVIKTTAGAVPGDSGGPMYDAQGEVVGITTAGEQTGSGASTTSTTVASYAVPIERALKIVDQIESGTESGTVKVGPNAYLGVSVQALQDGSVAVASVVSGAPAATAGLAAGDTITSVGGTSIDSRATLSQVLGQHNPGDKVRITWTDEQGQSHSATVTLGSSPVN